MELNTKERIRLSTNMWLQGWFSASAAPYNLLICSAFFWCLLALSTHLCGMQGQLPRDANHTAPQPEPAMVGSTGCPWISQQSQCRQHSHDLSSLLPSPPARQEGSHGSRPGPAHATKDAFPGAS